MIDTIMDFIREYDTTVPELTTAKVQAQDDKDRLLLWRTIVTANNFRSIFSQALTELRHLNDQLGITYIDKLNDFKIPEEEKYNYHSIHRTAQLFNEWCEEQHISPSVLLTEIFIILTKKNATINTLPLHGESNAGKTYWSKALSPFQDCTGQTIQSADFAWSKCIDKEIIMIPELGFTKPEQVEEAKKIFEGLPTSVNIKNKEARMLARTPILLQCNTLPWARQFSQERHAFLKRSFHHIDMKASDVLAETQKEANPLFFGRIFKELNEYDKTLPTWTHGKTDPIWDLVQEHAKKLNDNALVSWVIGDDFRHFLHANMMEVNRSQYHGILSDKYDRINACRSFILDNLDPYDKDQTIWSNDQSSALSAWLLAIANDSAEDYYWNIDSYEHPFVIDAKTREEIHLQDIDKAMYEIFRLAFVTVSLVYNKMQKWTDQPKADMDENMVQMRDSTFVLKKCVGKIKEYIEFIVKSCEQMKKSPEDGSVPRVFYPLVTSTPNKQHHVRIPDRKWPGLMKEQGPIDEIGYNRTYWLQRSGFYDRNETGVGMGN